MDDDLPLVTVIIPVLNEERHVATCLRSVQGQDYPRDRVEVLVADGGSTDRTREIVTEFTFDDPRIQLLDNPRRTQAAGLNIAIAASHGEVVARLDGHASWPPTHISRCVRLLDETGADNVGGAMDAIGETAVGEAVARAWRSRFAIGGARYRYATRQCETDTVWLGCFRRTALERVGPFDERFPPHEDYELNHRILSTGGRIVFSPELPTRYLTRSSWGAVARQYFRYGRAKVRVARYSVGVMRPHHLAPPLFVLGLVASPSLALRRRSRRVFLVVASGYMLASSAACVRVGRGSSLAVRLRIPFVFPVLHASWGAGFWAGVIEATGAPRGPRAH